MSNRGTNMSVTEEDKRKAEEILKQYTCQYTDDENGDGLPLVDVLSSGNTIKEGQQEIELLADEFADALAAEREKVLRDAEGLADAIRLSNKALDHWSSHDDEDTIKAIQVNRKAITQWHERHRLDADAHTKGVATPKGE